MKMFLPLACVVLLAGCADMKAMLGMGADTLKESAKQVSIEMRVKVGEKVIRTYLCGYDETRKMPVNCVEVETK